MTEVVIDMTEMRRQQIKQELEIFSKNKPRRRRRSCQCNWCGGISNVEVKLNKRLMMQKDLTPEEKKEKSIIPSSTVSSLRKIVKTRTQLSLKKKNAKNATSNSRTTPAGVKSQTFTKNSISSVGELEPNVTNSNIDKTPERSPSPNNYSRRRSTFLLSPTNPGATMNNLPFLKKLLSVSMKDSGSEAPDQPHEERKREEGAERIRKLDTSSKSRDELKEDSYIKEASLGVLMTGGTPKAVFDFGRNEVSGFSNMIKIDVIPDEETISNEASTRKNTEEVAFGKDDKILRFGVSLSVTGSPKNRINSSVEASLTVKEVSPEKRGIDKVQGSPKQKIAKKFKKKNKKLIMTQVLPINYEDRRASMPQKIVHAQELKDNKVKDELKKIVSARFVNDVSKMHDVYKRNAPLNLSSPKMKPLGLAQLKPATARSGIRFNLQSSPKGFESITPQYNPYFFKGQEPIENHNKLNHVRCGTSMSSMRRSSEIDTSDQIAKPYLPIMNQKNKKFKAYFTTDRISTADRATPYTTFATSYRNLNENTLIPKTQECGSWNLAKHT